jgi:2-polyprenyl-3-methyl-5-hydroxy-6-metoxy-1,4-benzoquinol methylase
LTWSYYEDPRPDIQALIDPSGLRILDVGCASGALASALKAHGAAHVAGIELDPDAAAKARGRIDELVEGSALDGALPWEPASFDVVVFADVLEHLPDPDRALERFIPLLSPSGRLVVSVPNMRFWSVLLRLIVDRWAYTEHGVRDRTHVRIFTRRSLLRMLDEHGLRLESLHRNQRLIDDQSNIGRLGAVATRVARATIGHVARDLMAYQYVAVARKP